MPRRAAYLIGAFIFPLFFLFVMGSFSPAVFAADVADHYYVDALIGNDATGDGTIAFPWRTVSHALSQVNNAGVEIHVAPGQYDEALGESFPLIMKSGVSLVGADREATILYGNGTDLVVHFVGTSYYTETTVIRGFKIMNGENGVLVTGRIGAPSTPLITDNWFTGNNYGVFNRAVQQASVSSYIIDNLIEDNAFHGVGLSASFWGTTVSTVVSGNIIINNGTHGVACFANGTTGSTNVGRCNPTISNNYIAGNELYGFNCKSQSAGECSGVLANNQISGNGQMAIGREHVGSYLQVNRLTFINNIIVQNVLGGVEFWPGDEPLFLNNTIVANGAIGIHGGTPTIVNSIIWGHGDDLDVAVSQVSYSDVGDAGYVGSNNNLSVDPLFGDLANGDLHIRGTSPLIDQGNSAAAAAVATDVDGDNRILGSAVDIGADETFHSYSIAIEKSVEAPTELTIADLVTYTLSIWNGGPASVAGLVVTDVLPADVSWGGYAETTAGTLIVIDDVVEWQGTVPSGLTTTVTFNAQVHLAVAVGTSIVNSADLAVPASTITTTNPVTVTVGPGAYWQNSQQTVNQAEALAGDPLTYTIRVANDGNATVAAVVTSTLDSVAHFVAADNGGMYDNGQLVWSPVLVNASQAVTLTFSVTTTQPITSGYVAANQVLVVGGGRSYQLPLALTALYNPASAVFTAANTTGPVPLSVTFSNLSANADSFIWQYGDGISSTVTGEHTHVYTEPGTYSVTLTALNPVSSATITHSRLISAIDFPIPAFVALPRIGEAPLLVTFTNQSFNADTYFWNYGDGTTGTSGDLNHSHLYSDPGVYTVTLTAQSPTGTMTLTRTHFIAAMTPSGQTAFHVDGLGGDDTLGDGSVNNPWLTNAHALGEVNLTDAIIYVASGQYDEALGESFPLIMKPGVSLVGADREATILYGNGTDLVVHFVGTSYYTESTVIRGFKIMNGENGVLVTGRIGAPSTPMITDNWFTGNNYGVFNRAVQQASVSSYVIDNLIEDNAFHGVGLSASFWGTTVTTVVSGNVIINNGTHGVACFAHGTSGSSDVGRCNPMISNNYIAGNELYGFNCKSQSAGECSGVLANNQIIGNGQMGIGREHVGAYLQVNRLIFINNIIAQNVLGGGVFWAGDEPLFVNNTIVENGAIGIHGGTPTIVNSIIWGHGDDLDVAVSQVSYSDVGEAGYAGSNNNLSVDPLFVDVTRNDYHLSETSLLIDAGNSAVANLPAYDFEGDPRIWASLVDIGADEVIRVYQQYLSIVVHNPLEGGTP